jgi:hypothetical protein
MKVKVKTGFRTCSKYFRVTGGDPGGDIFFFLPNIINQELRGIKIKLEKKDRV